MRKHSLSALLCGVSGLVLGMSAGAANAQDATDIEIDGVTILQTLIVTGDNFDRSLEQTAASVDVVTDEDLEEEPEAASVKDAIDDVPNVYYPASTGTPVIRGQDAKGPNPGAVAFLSGSTPRTSINVDGSYQNFYQAEFGTASIWDLDDIEVFRGPQTTSQGANAIAGAIIVHTKDPTFTPEGSFLTEYGSYNTKRVAGAISGPLTEDLAGRLAVDYSGRENVIDYVNSGFTLGDTDPDFMNFTARGKLLWEPVDIPGLSAKFTLAHNTTNRPTTESENEPFGNLQNTESTAVPTWFQDSNTGIVDLSYALENGVTLIDKAQYTDTYTKRTYEPETSGSAVISQQNFSNDARVTFGDELSDWSGVAGIYLAHTTSDEALYLGGTTEFDDNKDNLGLYSELNYRLTEDLTLTGGLRYEFDHIERYGTYAYAAEDLDYDRTFQALLPKVSVAYALTPEVTVGALVNRGYNPGGAGINVTSREWTTFEAETLWNYELFARTDLLDGDLQLTGNVFYTDFTNAQRYVTVDAVDQAYAINAEKAYSYGLELGVNWQLLDNLAVKSGVGILHSEITEMSQALSYVGNEFAGAPGYMLSFGVSWDVTPKLTASGDVQYLDGYFSDDENTSSLAVDPYAIANARLDYQINDNLKIYGYVKNIFDTVVPTYIDTLRGVTSAQTTTPRMIGVGLMGTF